MSKVRFHFGPYDGHVQNSPSPDTLAETVALPVNNNIFRMLRGLPPLGNPPTTSIAFYELDREGGELVYLFVGAASPEEVGA